jgi:hypothetical protein
MQAVTVAIMVQICLPDVLRSWSANAHSRRLAPVKLSARGNTSASDAAFAIAQRTKL